MIKHIVFFGVVDEAEGKSKAEIMQFVKHELENLIHLVPNLRKIEVGINHPEAPAGNFDLVLYSEFDSMADLDAYQVHPEHQKVAAYIGKIKTSRACVDYEV
ncbi:MAG: Dabb family protein [Paludibacter sp.]|nr:Dabb family protein [Paludibacter sp.]MDD4198277.1 Dabb family protein [Paludibacter sp.]MDD4426987.1 Dabb family protein [Paludibacter sp.]